MSSDDSGNGGGFDELMRSIAREFSRTIQERVDQVDLDDVAETFGVDPGVARQWIDGAAGWLRTQTDELADHPLFSDLSPSPRDRAPAEPADPADRPDPVRRTPGPARREASADPLRSAGPHPLDLPTDEQGQALAALSSGRWRVEPGTEALAGRGAGPGPSDALGLVRELRVRDWLDADGELTIVGRHALGRWLESADPHERS